MKLIYLGPVSLSDCDFPLIKAYQDKGIDVVYYIPISRYTCKGGILDLSNQPLKDGIYPASEIKQLDFLKDYVDLNKVFVINDTNKHTRLISSRLLWLRVLMHMKRQHADILHCSWYPQGHSKILYLLNIKKVLTVHDPIEHSSRGNEKSEQNRRIAFHKFNHLFLLNKEQKTEFEKAYGIDSDKISINKLGSYDCINLIKTKDESPEFSYILFFGSVTGYKGIEYLTEAAIKCHQKDKELNLVIAGGGKLYFDWTKYSSCDYIHLINRFIELPELKRLIDNCRFVVCPYTDATQSGVVQTALSLNKPVIVTNVGNLPRSIGDGKYGMVVTPKDTDSLAVAIDKLWNDPETLKGLEENIKSEWHKKMDWSSIASDYISIYKQLI